MTDLKLTLLHSFSQRPTVETVPCAYVAEGWCYLMPDKMTPIQYLKSIHEAEKERSEWIRKYDNLLQGLHYWQQRALNK